MKKSHLQFPKTKTELEGFLLCRVKQVTDWFTLSFTFVKTNAFTKCTDMLTHYAEFYDCSHRVELIATISKTRQTSCLDNFTIVKQSN